MSTSEKPVRFGIVGLGMGAGRSKTVPTTEGAQLVAVCDLLEERARPLAEELGCEWTLKYDNLLARDDIDVIGVFTPSGWHCDFAIRALQAGKHAFTTKPMDIRVAKCDAAIEAAKKAGKVLAVDFQYRYDLVNHQILQAVQQGAFGRVFQIDLRMKWYRGQDYYDGGSPPGWRSRKETEGGSVANQGVHYVDLMQWFGGPVRSILGWINTVGHKIETEDLSNSLWRFESGAWGSVVTTTCNTPGLGTIIEISGDQGTVIWKNNKIELWKTETGAKAEDFSAPADLPAGIIADMVSAVRKGTKPYVDGPEGRKTVAIIEAVYRSAAEGKPVTL